MGVEDGFWDAESLASLDPDEVGSKVLEDNVLGVADDEFILPGDACKEAKSRWLLLTIEIGGGRSLASPSLSLLFLLVFREELKTDLDRGIWLSFASAGFPSATLLPSALEGLLVPATFAVDERDRDPPLMEEEPAAAIEGGALETQCFQPSKSMRACMQPHSIVFLHSHLRLTGLTR